MAFCDLLNHSKVHDITVVSDWAVKSNRHGIVVTMQCPAETLSGNKTGCADFKTLLRDVN